MLIIKKKNEDKIEKNIGRIYYIAGSIFPIQLILTSELSGGTNFWLRKLTNNLKEKRRCRTGNGI